MSHVSLAPDGLGLLSAEHLERDSMHRRDGCELDQPLGLGVAKLRCRVRDCVEPGDEQPCRPFGT